MQPGIYSGMPVPPACHFLFVGFEYEWRRWGDTQQVSGMVLGDSRSAAVSPGPGPQIRSDSFLLNKQIINL